MRCAPKPIRLRRAGLAVLLAAAFLPGGGVATGTPLAALDAVTVARGFYATVFGQESGSDAAGDFVKKFVRPVRYHMVSTSRVDRRASVRDYLTALSAAVDNLDISETSEPESADLLVYLTDRADYVATIRATTFNGAASAFMERNACSSLLAARRSGIERAAVYLVADEGFAPFAHCLVEEVAQSLGPANDDDALAGSIFNDRSEDVGLGALDFLILSVLYDPRIRPGMGRADVAKVLPQVITDTQTRLIGAPSALVRSLP